MITININNIILIMINKNIMIYIMISNYD